MLLTQVSLGPPTHILASEATYSLVCSQLVKVSEQFCTSKGKL